MINCSIILNCLITFIAYCNAANIFCIFPTPSYSHQQPMLALSKALAAKGHNLTVITCNPSKVPIKNYREIDISIMYKKWHEIGDATETSLQKQLTAYQILKFCSNFVKYFTPIILELPQVQELIREVNGTNYDLILYESLYYGGLLGISDLIGNPPIIGLVTLYSVMSFDVPVGNPIIPSYLPNLFTIHTHKMTLSERIYNLWLHLLSRYILEFEMKPTQDKYIKKYFSNSLHTAEQFENNKSLLIISTDLSTGYPRPVQPNTIYVGPMHLQPPKPLPEDIQKWMDESEDGVIYFSFGSNMKGTSVPEDKRAVFIKVFSQFPKIRFLWKWEADTELPGQPINVLVKKWLPQQSILAHPKLKLFISQVGLQSFQEAINHGIPILGIPMFGDQLFNAGRLAQSGAGLVQEYNEISYDNIYGKIQELLSNSSYKQNMMYLKSITEDKPMSSLDTAVWWVEYVIRHKGAPHLRPAAIDMPWYQYFMIDIIIVLIFLLVIIFLIFYFIIKLIIKLIASNKKKTD